MTGERGIPYEVEIVTNCEFVGLLTQTNLTPSHGDDEAAHIAMEAAGSTLREQVGDSVSWASAFTRSLSKTYMDHKQTIVDLATLVGAGASMRAMRRIGNH